MYFAGILFSLFSLCILVTIMCFPKFSSSRLRKSTFLINETQRIDRLLASIKLVNSKSNIIIYIKKWLLLDSVIQRWSNPMSVLSSIHFSFRKQLLKHMKKWVWLVRQRFLIRFASARLFDQPPSTMTICNWFIICAWQIGFTTLVELIEDCCMNCTRTNISEAVTFLATQFRNFVHRCLCVITSVVELCFPSLLHTISTCSFT